MADTLDPPGVRALLLDIEGTTTPVRFVYDVLFPHARRQVAAFLERHRNDQEVRTDLATLRLEHAADAAGGQQPPGWDVGSVDAVAAYVHWLMDRDRKSPGLKSLQGHIWQAGYAAGELRGEVYADVHPAFERWRGQGREIDVFSSGSVLAQKLLFGTTPDGDLTRFIRSYFDTTTGAKGDPGSYRRIAAELGRSPAEVLFLSDVAAELDAARRAGLPTGLCVRDGDGPPAPSHPVIRTFHDVCP